MYIILSSSKKYIMKQIITLSLFAIIAFFASCENESTKTDNTDNTETNMTEETSLQDELNVKKDAFNTKAPEEKKKMYTEGIEAVAKSGVLENALQVGDQAPNFELTNATGKKVSLAEQLKNGPVILTWYRGGWCPYCNITLNRLQKELPNFTALGANLLALSPELPDSSISTSEKNELTFEVLSDLGNNVAREFGVVYKLPEPIAKAYQKGFDLHKYNGDESDELPLSATYVIAQDSKIKFAFLDAEYRNRAEPSDIIAVLESLK